MKAELDEMSRFLLKRTVEKWGLNEKQASKAVEYSRLIRELDIAENPAEKVQIQHIAEALNYANNGNLSGFYEHHQKLMLNDAINRLGDDRTGMRLWLYVQEMGAPLRQRLEALMMLENGESLLAAQRHAEKFPSKWVDLEPEEQSEFIRSSISLLEDFKNGTHGPNRSAKIPAAR